ncbi:MAG: helix-turn-helix domain-containing protein [Flavobacteriaceae bacterium]|nr:helix-turn-helix domain-containing protein [Flavobacteriaceae bacterium]MDG2499374.1 helix-turn-helix domain-containing protein [Flavobacteriaceae bacterium]
MRTNRSQCPLVNILDIVGDKWSLIIIRDLFLGKKTFTEFMNSPEKFASNILSNRLEFLINQGLLKVTKFPHDKKTKIYYLTDKGIDLYPILYEMMYWSKRNLDEEFGPLGLQFFKDSKRLSSKTFIKRTQSKYTQVIDEFLSV